VEIDDWGEADLDIEPEMGPPWALLAIGGACIVASAVLLVWRGQLSGLVGYMLAALLAVLAVAIYRYIDGRRRTFARYRPSQWAGRVAVGLLIAAWIVASGHAWQLATVWAKG
jgi:hypothetical protein